MRKFEVVFGFNKGCLAGNCGAEAQEIANRFTSLCLSTSCESYEWGDCVDWHDNVYAKNEYVAVWTAAARVCDSLRQHGLAILTPLDVLDMAVEIDCWPGMSDSPAALWSEKCSTTKDGWSVVNLGKFVSWPTLGGDNIPVLAR